MTRSTTDFDAVADESTVLDKRDARALTERMTVLDDVGPADPDADIYVVTTESGREYVVDGREGACECWDDRRDDRPRCKHRRRVAFATGARPIPAWADADAVDPQLGSQVDGPETVATDGGVIDAGDEGALLDDDCDVKCECDDLPDDFECARCAIATGEDGRFFWED